MIRSATLLLAFATVVVPMPTGAQLAGNVPFAVGERLEYEVRFGPIRVGSGSMEVMGIETVRGRDAWLTEFRVRGGNFLYRVNDVLRSWIDRRTFSSLRFQQDLDQGGRDRERTFEIYPERQSFTEMQNGGETGEEQPSVANPLDDGSFLYFIRTVPLEVGETYSYNRYFRPDRNPVTVRVLRKERVRVPAGHFDAIVIQPIIKSRGIFSEGGQAEIWLSDDDRRIMLQLKSKLSFGSLNLYLRSYRETSDPPAQLP
ncbi:MAG TPA: DUF3108 domain-containing protein [Gemmatimonadaceae bacterium]|nr:DUF3108 domain-containing protein [Gemmatimonadaceae bacterium]